MYKRIIDLNQLLNKKSHFLFGPRSTGKTTLIQQQLKEAEVFDLLNRDSYRRLLSDPSMIGRVPKDKIVVIDEIQKIPSLLDEVHRLIQKENRRFLLTGSSARKLKRGAANLLAGRAWQANLLPLTTREIDDFNLLQYLNRGGLPHVYGSEDYHDELLEYLSLYLREEVAAEALTRNIEAFSEFLDLVGLSNGSEINYQSFASDCNVSQNTIKNYFEILEDTLIGYKLKAFKKTKIRKAISRSKHFLFDVGVVNTLKKIPMILNDSSAFGDAFEHFIVNEVRAYNLYAKKREQLCYWRSVRQDEVDLVIDKKVAIEIKSTKQVKNKHLKGLLALKEEGLFQDYLIVSQDPIEQTHDTGIVMIPWDKFLDKLWKGSFF